MTRPTIGPITPNPVPREPLPEGTFRNASVAAVYACETGKPARVVYDDGTVCCTITVPREPERRPPNVAPLLAHMDALEPTDPVHAAERAFLAAYRAWRQTRDSFSPERTEAAKVYIAAEHALDAADAATRDGAK
jgi:hypothetical protein